MTANEVINLITTVGFPIVACGALFWYVVKEQKELREVVNNNTDVLHRILEHLSGEQDG